MLLINYVILALYYVLSLSDDIGTKDALVACPSNSICVWHELCNTEYVVFNVGDNVATLRNPKKYLCGVLDPTGGFVCCSDESSLPNDFQLTYHNWFFPHEATSSLRLPAVLPYLGYKAPLSDSSLPSAAGTNQEICPPFSTCVPPAQCRQDAIVYSPFPNIYTRNKLTCGIEVGTYGFLCCSLSVNDQLGFSHIHYNNKKLNSIKHSDSIDVNFTTFAPQKNISYNIKIGRRISKALGRSNKAEETWECGRSVESKKTLLRIYAPIGNHTAVEGQYPWHVGVLTSNHDFLCSGIIVSEFVVLTTAYCVAKYRPAELIIRVGDLDFKSAEKYTAYDVPVAALIVHPDYHEIKLENDVSVVKVSASLRQVPHVNPICLPPQHSYQSTTNINSCKVAGWGQFSNSLEDKEEISYKLRDANFYIVPRAECQKILRYVPKLGAFFKLQPRVICAKGYSNADTCKGDGGSGLICEQGSKYELKGLVSWGIGCGVNLPGVYTDVSKHLQFIASNLGKDERPFHNEYTTTPPLGTTPNSNKPGYSYYNPSHPYQRPPIQVLLQPPYKLQFTFPYDYYNNNPSNPFPYQHVPFKKQPFIHFPSHPHSNSYPHLTLPRPYPPYKYPHSPHHPPPHPVFHHDTVSFYGNHKYNKYLFKDLSGQRSEGFKKFTLGDYIANNKLQNFEYREQNFSSN